MSPGLQQSSADSMPPISVVVGWVMGCPWGTARSQSTMSGTILPRPTEDVLLVKDDVLLHSVHQFHTTHCQRVVIQVDWQSKFLHPILQPSGVSHGQQQRPLSNILIGWLIREKHIPGETFGGRGCSVLLAWEGLTSNHWDRKRGADFPG